MLTNEAPPVSCWMNSSQSFFSCSESAWIKKVLLFTTVLELPENVTDCYNCIRCFWFFLLQKSKANKLMILDQLEAREGRGGFFLLLAMSKKTCFVEYDWHLPAVPPSLKSFPLGFDPRFYKSGCLFVPASQPTKQTNKQHS